MTRAVIVLVCNKLTLRAPYQFDPLSSPTSSSSCYDPALLVDLFRGVFQSRITTLSLLKVFPLQPSIYPFIRLISWNYDNSLFQLVWQSLAAVILVSAVDEEVSSASF